MVIGHAAIEVGLTCAGVAGAGKGVLGWVPSRADWRSPSQQSTPDWKIRSGAAAAATSAPATPEQPRQAPSPPGKPPLPRPGSAVRGAGAAGALAVHAEGGAPPPGAPVLATPREVKVVLGNKAMLAAEGVPVPRPVDEYMRDMEVQYCPAPPCGLCARSLLSPPDFENCHRQLAN